MGPENRSIRFKIFCCLLMITTLNSISADPQSTDFLAFYDSSIETNPDELSFGPDQPGSLPFDVLPDSSFMVSALSDSSDIDAKGSYFGRTMVTPPLRQIGRLLTAPARRATTFYLMMIASLMMVSCKRGVTMTQGCV